MQVIRSRPARAYRQTVKTQASLQKIGQVRTNRLSRLEIHLQRSVTRRCRIALVFGEFPSSHGVAVLIFLLDVLMISRQVAGVAASSFFLAVAVNAGTSIM